MVDDISTNASDHYPVLEEIQGEVSVCNEHADTEVQINQTRWNKVDLDLYAAMVKDAVQHNQDHSTKGEKY